MADKHTYTVDIRALQRVPTTDTWIFEFCVWRYTNTWQGRIPPMVYTKMEFTGTQDAAREASQTFLDLVKIKDEAL